jgi:thioredoxin 1
MKKIFSLIVVIAALGSLSFMKSSENDGIKFKDISFNEALKEAKASNKLIFMDAYAEWCGPCKYMAANTFKDTDVAKYFNQNFINLKIDMEKGEGPALASRFQVRAYPTLFFINGDGVVVRKVLGAQKPADLLKEARMALN